MSTLSLDAEKAAPTLADLIERVEYERNRFNDIADTLERGGIITGISVAHRDAATRMDNILTNARAEATS